MGIPRSTYYYPKKENSAKEQQEELLLKEKIQEIAYQYPYYGYRRITAQLQREKIKVNHKRVLRLMRQLGIQGRIKRRYITTTNSRHSHRIYPNLIKEKFVTGINQVWCSLSPIYGSSPALSTWPSLLTSTPAGLSAMLSVKH